MASTPSSPDPVAFLEAVTPAGRRRDALALLDLMREVTGLEPAMHASSIVGFGEYAYRYSSGTRGTAPAAAFAPRKAASVVYLLDGVGHHEADLQRLGPHATGVGCLYIKDLTKVDLAVLSRIIRQSFEALTAATYERRAHEAAKSERATRGTKAPRRVAPKKVEAKRPRVLGMSFGSVYPLYVQKAAKKGRTQQEVDEVIGWLTGYRGEALRRAVDDGRDVETFLHAAPQWHDKAHLITGLVCGVRVEEVADPWMRRLRYLDKLIDELAKGKPMSRILRG